MKHIIYILIFLVSCEKYQDQLYQEETPLSIYTDLELDDNIYTYYYPEGDVSSYFKIHFQCFQSI